MPKVTVYNTDGKKVKEHDLPEYLFNVAPNHDVIHQVIVAQQHNHREVLAHTKNRSEVRGGGIKPWRQKGTGRARHGSIRSPLWKGGGVTFGPRNNRNFTKLINKKTARQALAMILSDKVANNQFVVVDALNLPEVKTKALVNTLERLPTKGAKSLLLLSKNEKDLKRAGENLDTIKTYKADSVNAEAAIACPWIVISEEGLKEFVSAHKE
jgi:large subunit ribosomal protein L4